MGFCVFELLVAERAGIEHEHRRVVAELLGAVEIGRAVHAIVAGPRPDPLLERLVVVERIEPVGVERGLVDEVGAGRIEARVARRRRAAGEVIGDLVVVDGAQHHRRGAQIGQEVRAAALGQGLLVFGAEVVGGFGLRGEKSRRRNVGVDGVAELDEEVETALVGVAERRKRRQAAAPIADTPKVRP